MIVVGDCVAAMREMDVESVDAIVTDPPYGLAFMGKRWDYDVPGVDAFVAMLRVLKPGGRLLCFAGTRTMHRMWCNIEDAGFTIEDSIVWLYGSGFPKHRSKLKPAHEPICVARKPAPRATPLNIDECRIPTDEALSGGGYVDHMHGGNYSNGRAGEASAERRYGKRGATDLNATPGPRGGDPAGRWPANVVLDEEAAQVLDEQSGAAGGKDGRGFQGGSRPIGFANVGSDAGDGRPCGPLYGDSGGASRFYKVVKWTHDDASTAGSPSDPSSERGASAPGDAATSDSHGEAHNGRSGPNHGPAYISVCESCIQHPNLARDAVDPASTGTIPITPIFCGLCGSVLPVTDAFTSRESAAREVGASDRESATRFLYSAKASRSERDAGLDGMPAVEWWHGAPNGYRPDQLNTSSAGGTRNAARSRNHHPTVKPIDLMRWLVRLVTPAGGLVLDPFAGSGTTGIAAVLEGREFIGIEREAEYAEIARQRIRHYKETTALDLFTERTARPEVES